MSIAESVPLDAYLKPEAGPEPEPLTVRECVKRRICPACRRRAALNRRRTLCRECVDAGLAYCPACETVKPLAEMSLSFGKVAGHRGHCRACNTAMARARRKSQPRTCVRCKAQFWHQNRRLCAECNQSHKWCYVCQRALERAAFGKYIKKDGNACLACKARIMRERCKERRERNA